VSIGTLTWDNPSGAKAHDVDYALASICCETGGTSHYLKATNFDFFIPSGATIDGIVVEIEKRRTDFVFDNAVRIVKRGIIGTVDKSADGQWPVTDTYVSYGSPIDLWLEETEVTWTADDINAPDFGVVISASMGGLGPNQAFVNHIRIRVYYTE